MKNQNPDLPLDCQNALQAIENDPLELPRDVLQHISTCRMCSETRVMWIAQEDFEHPIVHAGYFDSLPNRIFRKLPTHSTRLWLRLPLLVSAASIMFITAASLYWLGRQSQPSTVVLEALIPPKDMHDYLHDFTSFYNIELFAQVSDLTPEETQALISDIKKPEASVQPTEPEW